MPVPYSLINATMETEMADISFGHGPAGTGFLPRLGRSILAFFENIARANSRVRLFEQLNALSDEQLAARGLKREDIVQYVFRDAMHY